MKKKSKYRRIILILLILTLLSGVTCFFPSACDWYTDHLYGYFTGLFSRLCGLIPVSVGEILTLLAILAGVLSIPFLILLIFLRKKNGYKRFCAGWFKTLLMTGVIALFLMVPCWLIPVCGNVLGKDNTGKRTDYDFKELTALYVHMVEGLNQAAEDIPIAEDGSVNFPTDDEIQPLITEALRSLADEYPRLSGYYPPVKIAFTSDIYERMGIGGMTYSLLAEATRNKYQPPYFIPILNAHELCHVKGFSKENETNFIAMFALSQSENAFLRFSAYDDILRYLYEKWETAADQYLHELAARGEITLPVIPEYHPDMTQEEKQQMKAALQEYGRVYNQVFADIPKTGERAGQIYNTAQDIREQTYQEDSHPIDEMPAVQEAFESARETHWEIYAEYMQENSYDGVVLLFLQYYDGKLY